MYSSFMPGALLRLVVYDRTCRGGTWPPGGLSSTWRTGAVLHRGLHRLDACHGASSWRDALRWLAAAGEPRPVAEIQFWGHGNWGLARIGRERLDRTALVPGHPLEPLLRTVRERLVSGWWFRTCETFGAAAGHDLARAWADFLGVDVAGHTHRIAFFQSGLHRLRPGEAPGWSPAEGLARGTPERPLEALPSRPGAPNTITCFHGRIPERFGR